MSLSVIPEESPSSIPPIPAWLANDETIQLFVVYRETKSKIIRDKIAANNERLVLYVMNRFYMKNRKYQNIKDDLQQEGNIGLLTAIGKFKYEMGNKFSTYAIWWIRQSIDKFLLNQFDVIRTPIHINLVRTKAAKFMRQFSVDNGRQPTKEEIRDFLGVTDEIVDNMVQSVKNQTVTSLDEPMPFRHNQTDDKGTTLHDFISDENQTDLDRKLFNETLSVVIYNSLKNLTRREIEILFLRYGIVDDISELEKTPFIEELKLKK